MLTKYNKNLKLRLSTPSWRGMAGFTLMELLVVISIIGLLSSLAIVSLSSARAKARDALRKADMAQLRTALSLYFDDNKRYPVSVCEGGDFDINNAPLFGTDTDLSTIEASADCYLNDLVPELEAGTRPLMQRTPRDPMNEDNNASIDPLLLYRYITADNGREYALIYFLESDLTDPQYIRGW